MGTSKVERVDDIPLIFHWLMKMRVAELIDQIWRPHGNWQGLSYGQLAVLFITYVVHSLNHRLSGMESWLVNRHQVLEQLTGWTIDLKEATDDRLGILLSELGEDEERIVAYQNRQGQYVVQAYDLPREVARYDTSSFNVFHAPEKSQGGGLLDFGHSKDKQPDRMQFKQGLGTLDPAGVPIFTETLAGNRADDPLYVPVWRTMSETLGRKDFLFVADCKAGALETRATIAREGGGYLFPLAMTGKVPEELLKLVTERPEEPEAIILDDILHGEGKGRRIGKGFEVEKPMEAVLGGQKYEWMERWQVILSDKHKKRKEKHFLKRLDKAEKEVKKQYPKPEESREAFAKRLEKIFEKHRVSDFLLIPVEERKTYQKRYLKRGRPGPDTPYEIEEISEYICHLERDQEAIEKHCETLGWRIYVTNIEQEKMSLEQSVRYYRDEWTVERGFHRFKKGCLPVLPLFLRLSERVKGLMLLLFIALQAMTLMEFVVRRSLSEEEEKLAGLVPGNPTIKTARPTAERLLSQFRELHLLVEYSESEIMGHLVEKLTPLQRKILALLKVSEEIYNLSFSKPNVRSCTELDSVA